MPCPCDCLLRDPRVPVRLDLQHCHLRRRSAATSARSRALGRSCRAPQWDIPWQWSSSVGRILARLQISWAPQCSPATSPPSGPTSHLLPTWKAAPEAPRRLETVPRGLPGQALLGGAHPLRAAGSVPVPCALLYQGCHSLRRKRTWTSAPAETAERHQPSTERVS